MSENGRLLMVGLDAADPVLIERWTADGTLPFLAGLRAQGILGRLETSARYLAGSPWPTFYTGRHPGHHGIYHDFQWRHEATSYQRPDWSWLPAVPFWRTLRDDVRVVAVDVPMTLGCQQATGVELTGWASHDSLAPPTTHPEALLGEIRRDFGHWPVGAEGFGRLPVADLLALRDRLSRVTEVSSRVALHLMSYPWDLAIVVFGALHRGGHRLWDRTSIKGPVAAEEGRAFDGSLRTLYQDCDRAVGALVEAAPDATVVVFSLHGMMVNSARVDLLSGMLDRILGVEREGAPRRSLVRRLGEGMPPGLRRAVTRRIPARLRDGLVTRWETGAADWSHTRAFPLRADLQGYVRLNLEDREAQGVVSLADYDATLEEIVEGLRSFADADTGEAVVADVVRPAADLSAGSRAERLPDLAVLWPESPGGIHRALASPRHGTVHRETPGQIPNGRSGNHRGQGFLIAAGPSIPPGSSLPEAAQITDLAPTVLELLGTTARLPLDGKPIDLSGRRPVRPGPTGGSGVVDPLPSS